MVRRATLLATLAVALTPAAAQANWQLATAGHPTTFAAPATGAELEFYDEAGKLVLRVTDKDLSASWSSCAPDGICTQIADQETDGTQYRAVVARPGDVPAGTVFEAVLQRPGQPEERLRTPAWLGPQAVQTSPGLVGDATVGGVVTVTTGTAAGGFASPVYTSSEIWACAQPTSGPCYVISHPKFSKTPTVTLEARWAGWYLLAGQSWDSGHVVRGEPTVWVEPPWGPFLAPVAARRYGLSAPVGPITGPPAAPTPVPVARVTPTVSLRDRALRSKGRMSVGRITCADGCKVALKVSGGGKKALTTTFTVKGTKALTVPVRRGKLTVRVHADGKLITTGKVTAR